MVYLECNPDELLCKKLGIPKRLTKHHNDKGRICNYLIRQNGHIGLVDEDPNSAKPGSILKFKKEKDPMHDVLCHKDANGNRLITICPRFEGWLIKVCKNNKVDITNFNLSNNETSLHNEINSKLKELDKLLSHLLEIEAREILYLQNLLKGGV